MKVSKEPPALRSKDPALGKSSIFSVGHFGFFEPGFMDQSTSNPRTWILTYDHDAELFKFSARITSRMFLCLQDPDPLVRCSDSYPKNLDFYCFVTI